jgi:hypothetical protein
MTDLERVELALRRALSATNPHQKSEVVFREFLAALTEMNAATFREAVQSKSK